MSHFAYEDTALHIGYGQTISQPTTVAIMTQYAKIQKGDRVLEIGTGSGFSRCDSCNNGSKSFHCLEREYDLFLMAREKFDKLGYGIQTKWGDGSIGWNEFAPYDAILVTAGSPSIPEPLKNQLAIGGRLIIPVGERDSQLMVIIHKTGQNEFSKTELPNFAFVPLLGKEGWTKK
jgi:protein-L-isoaspartate(D-aspartate) O-methyltransferase